MCNRIYITNIPACRRAARMPTSPGLGEQQYAGQVFDLTLPLDQVA